MATIGSFKKVGDEYQGEIVTLSVQTKGVRIVPEANRSSDKAPSHRVYVRRAEIGAAWPKRSNEGRDYLSVKLDDPSFTAPILPTCSTTSRAKATRSCGRAAVARAATRSGSEGFASGTSEGVDKGQGSRRVVSQISR